jgi:hypothetical protein
MTRSEDCITLAEAAHRLDVDLGYLRRSSVRAKHGLEEVQHPLCLDDRITFLSRTSVDRAVEALHCTRQLRARTKKLELVAASSNFQNAQ